MYNISTAGHTLIDELGKSTKFIDDEVVVVSATPNRIQQTILEKIEQNRESFKEMGMVMERTKTEVVILNANLSSIKSPTGDIILKTSIKYLGYYIKNNLKMHKLVDAMLSTINQMAGRIWHFPTCQQNLKLNSTAHTYTAY